MYCEQLYADGRNQKDSFWLYPNSLSARRAARARGESLGGFEISC